MKLIERYLQAERSFNQWPKANQVVNVALVLFVVCAGSNPVGHPISARECTRHQ